MRTIALLGAVFLAAVMPTAAAEFSLTGSYQGFFVCDDVTDGAGGGFGRPMAMEIVQSGDRIDMRNTVVVDPSGPESHTLYRGRVAADAGGAAGGLDHAEEQVNGGGLAGAVRPQEAEDLPRRDLQAQRIQRPKGAVLLRQSVSD